MNPHNELSRKLTKSIRAIQPSLKLISKWRLEWIEKGLDKKMSFQSYKVGQCRKYHRERYLKAKTK